MKTGWKVFLIILAILILIGGGLVIWQWKTIQLLTNSTKYSAEEIETQLQQHQESLRQAVEEIPDVTIRDITQEERDALREGTMSREELISRITAPAESGNDAVPSGSGDGETSSGSENSSAAGDSETSADNSDAYEAQLSALIGESYVLREEYTMELEAIEARAISEYKGFTAEQKKKTALLSWASGYLDEVTGLEKECDAKMNDLIDRISKVIKDNNGDESLIDTLRSAYQDEKQLKKSYYVAELRKRGLI